MFKAVFAPLIVAAVVGLVGFIMAVNADVNSLEIKFFSEKSYRKAAHEYLVRELRDIKSNQKQILKEVRKARTP